LVYYSEVYHNFLDGVVDYGIAEFGNKDFESLTVGTFYNEIYNTLRYNTWEAKLSEYLQFIPSDYPFKALSIELSIYSSIALLFENGFNLNTIGYFIFYMTNLLTGFSIEFLFYAFDIHQQVTNI
jgi:hypothetical protein